MAITKILARKARLDVGIRYVLNGDKTDDKILTAHQNCDPGLEYREMLATKRAVGNEGGVQYYHMIQSFQPGEVTPELALSIAKEFAREHLSGYEVVIGTHVDRGHIHSHLLFNSVSVETGEKYHSNARSYYQKIRAVSDRLCQEHDLSIVLEGQGPRSLSYIEWLRQSKEQPTPGTGAVSISRATGCPLFGRRDPSSYPGQLGGDRSRTASCGDQTAQVHTLSEAPKIHRAAGAVCPLSLSAG